MGLRGPCYSLCDIHAKYGKNIGKMCVHCGHQRSLVDNEQKQEKKITFCKQNILELCLKVFK